MWAIRERGVFFAYSHAVPECIKEVQGKVFDSVYVNEDRDELVFENSEVKCVFYHEQDCCESVYIDDIVGDLNDLIGTPIILAEERDSFGMEASEELDSSTWTFYSFRTIKGSVDVKWYGTSNGYYSESVNLKKFDKTSMKGN